MERVRGQVVDPYGPLVRVRIAPPDRWSVDTSAAGATSGEPPGLDGWGVVDTGAVMSCVTQTAADRVKAPRGRPVTIRGVQGAFGQRQPQTASTCLLGCVLGDSLSPHEIQAPIIEDMGMWDGVPLLMLTGRDILAAYTLVYDGPTRHITLQRPPPLSTPAP